MNIRKTLSLGMLLIAGAFSAVQADDIRYQNDIRYFGEVDEVELDGVRAFQDPDGRKYHFDEITGKYFFKENGRTFWRDIEDGEAKRLDLDGDGDHERNINVKLVRGFRTVDDLDRDYDVRRYRSFRSVDIDEDDDDGRMPRWWRRVK